MNIEHIVGQSTDKEVGRLQGQVERLLSDLDKTLELLLGDGQPGALERLTRIEEGVESVTNIVEKNAQAIGKLTDVEKKLTMNMALHLNDKTNHSSRMLLDRKTISCFIGGFIILYLFLENIVNIPIWFVQILALLGLGM